MNAYDNFQNGFSILCNEYSSDIPFSNTYCIASGVRIWIVESSINGLLSSSFGIVHIWHGILQLAELYVNVIEWCSGRSPSNIDKNG